MMKSGDLSQRLEALSPAQRALLRQRLAAKGGPAGGPTIRRRTPADPRVLSFSQQRLWFLDQLTPGTATYNVPFCCRIEGDLDAGALARAAEAVVRRHEVLRTVFLPLKGRPVPALPKAWRLPFRAEDLRGRPGREAEAEALLRREAARPFDLARDVMLRCLLLRVEEREHVFLHTSHHIAWDLRSKELFYQELSKLYEAEVSGRPATLAELPVQYADYALWQRTWLRGEALARLEDYWKRQLGGAPPHLDLPTDRPRPAVQSLRGAKLPVRVPAGLLEAVRALSLRSGVTPFMTLLAAFKTFLYCRTGQADLCVGSPVLGRQHVETEGLIGFFINTVVLRTQVSPRLTLRELAGRTKQTTLGAVEHQALPFEKVVEVLRPPREAGRMPLFQVNFRLQGPPPAPVRAAGLVFGPPTFIDSGNSKFDLALELPFTPESRGFWEYSTDLFDEATVVQMADDFARLLADVVARPDTPLEEVPAVRDLLGRRPR
jgi:hypothetical protein